MLSWPLRREGGRRVPQGAALAPHRAGVAGSSPGSRVSAQTGCLQSTAGELRPDVLVGESVRRFHGCPSLGLVREWTEPRSRDQSSTSKGGSREPRVTVRVSGPWGAERGGLCDPRAESPYKPQPSQSLPGFRSQVRCSGSACLSAVT